MKRVITAATNPTQKYQQLCEDKCFFDIENDMAEMLGLYLDFSSVRGDHGPVFIYSDPDHECESDMWDGDEDALITQVDFYDYASAIANTVAKGNMNTWEGKYRVYLESLIEGK